MTRSGDVARRSFVTVSAMPEESHASSRSPLTFEKSRTAITGCDSFAAAARGCGAFAPLTSAGFTGAMKR
jgi:hypothetical protein